MYSTKKMTTNTSTRQQCYGNSPTKKQGYWGPTNEYVELVGDDPRADAIFSKVDSLMDSAVLPWLISEVSEKAAERCQ